MKTAVAALAMLLVACTQLVHRAEIATLDSLPSASALKAHMQSNDVYVLNQWQVVDSGNALLGVGVRYNAARARLDSGTFTLARDSITLLEAGIQESRFPVGLGLFGAMTVIYGAVSLACLADPKACFGSCPTFYVQHGSREVLQAEGFSASIARVLEATDLDPLYHARPSGDRFALVMRNEALETHVVRTVRLQAVRRPVGGRVFATADRRFYAARRVVAPDSCRSSGGDCRAAIAALDATEYRSLTDSNDLAARETVELAFPAGSGASGLVLAARHSFVSTYVFYQMLAHMGRSAGTWLAQLERLGPEQMPQALGLIQTLGGIEVSLQDADGSWRPLGTYHEAGPIATDVQIMPFTAATGVGPVRVRLRMARGNWRIDYVALAPDLEPADPLPLDPIAVERDGAVDTAALASLRDSTRALVTQPGDAYHIVFALPPQSSQYELFLESRGYYYEWLRQEWLREENPAMVALATIDPGTALRQMARGFKDVESRIEQLFWQSRFGLDQRRVRS